MPGHARIPELWLVRAGLGRGGGAGAGSTAATELRLSSARKPVFAAMTPPGERGLDRMSPGGSLGIDRITLDNGTRTDRTDAQARAIAHRMTGSQ